jgi:hypothetical protein
LSITAFSLSKEYYLESLNSLNTELNPICHLLSLLGAHHIFYVSRIRVNDLHCSPNILRMIKIEKNVMGGACSTYGDRRGVYRVLVGKPEGQRPLGRPRRRWEDNINMDLQEVGCVCMDWIELALNRGSWRALVNAVMNLRVP